MRLFRELTGCGGHFHVKIEAGIAQSHGPSRPVAQTV